MNLLIIHISLGPTVETRPVDKYTGALEDVLRS